MSCPSRASQTTFPVARPRPDGSPSPKWRGMSRLFVPLGFYLALTWRGSGVWRRVGVIAAVSVCVEVLQYVLAVGVSDVDDVILNGVGGLVGLLVYRLARWIVRQPSHLRTTVSLLSLVVAGPVLGFLMFVVRLRM